MKVSDSYTYSRYLLFAPLQIDGKKHYLGNYDDEADAARAFDRVARVLGRPLNFPEDDESDIVGPRSEGTDQAVITAMETAKTLMGKSDKAKKKKAANRAKKAAERAKKGAEVQSHKLRASNGLTDNLTTTLTILDQTGSSEYTGVSLVDNKWRSNIRVSRGCESIG